MVNRFVHFLEILFPPRKDQLLVSRYSHEPSVYKPQCIAGVWHIASYHQKDIKAAILENKFYRNVQATQLLADLLEQFISEKSISEALFIPIPLSAKRFRERGYNQSLLILNKLPAGTNIETNLLSRIRNTPPQMKLERSKRLLNLKGAFAVSPTNLERAGTPPMIVVVDDVVTTGATLLEAKATLSPHFPDTKIICLAIAH